MSVVCMRKVKLKILWKSSRLFATRAPPKPNQLYVFDRQAKLVQRERAASIEDSKTYDYIKEEVD